VNLMKSFEANNWLLCVVERTRPPWYVKRSHRSPMFIANRMLTLVDVIPDLQHSILMELLGNRLTIAPIDTIPLHNVLDIATGEPDLSDYRTNKS
jgi:hypothetical protein